MSLYPNSLQNQFLIAMPHLQDPNFAGSLTYICDHSEHGAMGIIINRPLDITLGEILDQLDMGKLTDDEFVYSGGPVQIDRGFVLHRPIGHWQSTLPIANGICLTTSRDILAAVAQQDGPKDKLVALGYAGWGAGQLEREIAENVWLTCPADEQILFRIPYDQKLNAAMSLLGVDIHRLSTKAGHA